MPNVLSGAMLVTELGLGTCIECNYCTYFNVNITLRDSNISKPNKDKNAIKRDFETRVVVLQLHVHCKHDNRSIPIIKSIYCSNLRLIDIISCEFLKLHFFHLYSNIKLCLCQISSLILRK